VAHFCEANRGDQADISRSDDGNFDVFTHDWGVSPHCRGYLNVGAIALPAGNLSHF
jgi:hypothetical protein